MEEVIKYLIELKVGGNTGMDYASALLWFIGLMISFKIIKSILIGWLKRLARKTKSDIDDFAIQVINELKPPFYLSVAIYVAAKQLALVSFVDKIIVVTVITVLIVQAILVAQKIIDYLLENKLYSKIAGEDDAKNKMAIIRLLSQITKALLWILGVLMILSNLGVNINSLIAGLGIGGVAIAFALQGVLGDLFSSAMIFLDQPFKVGDQVRAGADTGTVRKVGMRTSRITTMTGEELVISNTEISSSRVHNLSRRERRRVSFNLGVTYDTGSKKLKEIPDIIEGIVKSEKDTKFGRARFVTFGDSALIFEVVYHANVKDINLFKELQERINLAIYEEFEKKKIEFAYPSQTVYVNKS